MRGTSVRSHLGAEVSRSLQPAEGAPKTPAEDTGGDDARIADPLAGIQMDF